MIFAGGAFGSNPPPSSRVLILSITRRQIRRPVIPWGSLVNRFRILTSFPALILVLLCSLASTATPAPAAEPPQRVGIQQDLDLELFLEQVRQEHNLPAVAAAIVTSEGVQQVAAVGVRRNDATDRVTLEDRFHLGSVTKSITATCIALLVEEGVIEWTTTVPAVFPELVEAMHPAYAEVTLKDLLNHRSGVPAYVVDGEFESAPVPAEASAVTRRRAFAVWMLQQPPATTQGEYLYSNAGYSVATAMCEAVSGECWEDLVTYRVLQPLGLKTADFGWPNEFSSRQPWGHGSYRGSNDCWPVPPGSTWRLTDLSAPAGDVHMSVTDLARYVQFHMRGLRGEAGTIPAETIRQLHQPAGKYALGWFVGQTGGELRSWHPGSAGTFLSSVQISHERDIAAIFLCNVHTEGADTACVQIIDHLMGEIARH